MHKASLLMKVASEDTRIEFDYLRCVVDSKCAGRRGGFQWFSQGQDGSKLEIQLLIDVAKAVDLIGMISSCSISIAM